MLPSVLNWCLYCHSEKCVKVESRDRRTFAGKLKAGARCAPSDALFETDEVALCFRYTQ